MNITIDLNSDKIKDIKLDKNRYYLLIKNTDSVETIANVVSEIIKNNLFSDVYINDTSWTRFYHWEKFYTKNPECGYSGKRVNIKDNYNFLEFYNLYDLDNVGWRSTLKTKRTNSDLIIQHGNKDFRFLVTTEVKFPITKYLKYINASKKEKAKRVVEKNVQKFVGELTWISVMGELMDRGYENHGFSATKYNPLDYVAYLTNGRSVIITLRKDSLDEDPRFDIWMLKCNLGRKLPKEGMLKLVESLIDMGLVQNASKNN